MNRRHFLFSIGGSCAILIGGGAGALWFARRSIWKKPDSHAEFPKDIQALYHQEFAEAFPDRTLDELMGELRERRIYSGMGFDIAQVRRNAVRDPLIEFKKFFYTESELLLYAVVARLYTRDWKAPVNTPTPIEKP